MAVYADTINGLVHFMQSQDGSIKDYSPTATHPTVVMVVLLQ